MGRLKDFFFGAKPEEPQTPDSTGTTTDDEDEQAGLEEQAAAVPYTNRHPWGDFSLRFQPRWNLPGR